MRSKIIIQQPTPTSMGIKGLDSLLDVYDNTKAGDVVIVYPGTYDIGNNSIQLKDGVHWHFFPGVTITSDSTGGTFKDNNVQCNLRFDGFPTITNSNGLDKRIVLQHASSLLDGFYWEYCAQFQLGIEENPTVFQIFRNTLGGDLVWTRNSTGIYYGTLSGVFTENNHSTYLNFSIIDPGSLSVVSIEGGRNSANNVYQIASFDGNGDPVDTGIVFELNIKVIP